MLLFIRYIEDRGLEMYNYMNAYTNMYDHTCSLYTYTSRWNCKQM